jgi:hypothetical protein
MALENSKHEQFCQVWLETGNKSEAYRKSHPNSLKWKDETVHNKAYALSKRGEVLARFEQLQEDTVKAHGVTIESLIEELNEARQAALTADTPQSSAAITATMSKAKLVGLDKHQVEITGDIKVRKTLDDFYG